MLTKKIFTPGPTQVHPEVLKATISHDTYHRSQAFKEFHMGLLGKLKKLFKTEQYINILTTSGTGAMEAAVLNFCAPGEKILFLHQGRFGARWGAIAKAHGLNANGYDITYGDSIKPEQYSELDLDGVAAVLITHVETSTATLTDIASLAKHIHENSDALVIVDAVTSVGAVEFRMDEWGIDVAVSASQKGLMTQPGIAIIAYNERAMKKMADNPMPRFFFDLRKEAKSVKEENLTMWTPAVGIFYGVDKACDIILEHGLENRWKHTKELADYFRNVSIENGFGIFSKSPADSLTAITLPDGIPTGNLIKPMREKYDVRMANGQAELRDKIARVSHMGDLELSDMKELNELLKKEYEALKT